MNRKSILKNVFEWIAVLVIAIVASLFLRTFVISPFVVPTGSMEHTIEVGDHLLAQKVTVNLGQRVKPGDIIVFENPDGSTGHDILVKRVIATAGQTVDVRDGAVYIDGEPLDEPYVEGTTYPLLQQAAGVDISYPLTVPENGLWVMGDNRENSADSRYFGCIDEGSVIGVVVARYLPVDRIGLL